jgi:hypothetical protein
MFNLHHVDLIRPPLVVGKKPETVKAARFDGIQFALAEKGLLKENPHPLGSADYVAWEKRSGLQQDGTLSKMYRRVNLPGDQVETKARPNKVMQKLYNLRGGTAATQRTDVDEP